MRPGCQRGKPGGMPPGTITPARGVRIPSLYYGMARIRSPRQCPGPSSCHTKALLIRGRGGAFGSETHPPPKKS